MCNKIKLQLYEHYSMWMWNLFNSNFTRPIGCFVVLWLSNVQKMAIKTWKNVPDSSSLLWFQTSKDEQFNFSTIFSGCQIGQVCVTFKSDQPQGFHLKVLSLQSCTSFENFFCFHLTLGISPKDLEGFKADIAFIYTALACSLVILPQILTFVTWNFIGSCIVRCAFWLVSRKDDCLERELRKSFWIKKLINKYSIHLSN